MPYKTLLTSFHAGITGRIAAVVAVVAGNPGNMAANNLLNKTQAGLKYILNWSSIQLYIIVTFLRYSDFSTPNQDPI